MRSFSLLELIVVVVIVGVLAVLGAAQYGGYRERTLNKEALANLRLIQAAQRVYFLEHGHYYPPSGTGVSTISDIDSNLKLTIPSTDANPKWNYNVSSTGETTATRAGDDSRALILPVDSETAPRCTGSTKCP